MFVDRLIRRADRRVATTR